MTTTSKKQLHCRNHRRELRKRILHQFSPTTPLQNAVADYIVNCSLRLQTELSLLDKPYEQDGADPTAGAPTASRCNLWERASIRLAIQYLSDLIRECDEYPKLREQRKEEIRKLFG